MILAHVSDTHLGERPQNAARLRQLAHHLRARLTSGEEIALALTGDLTHDGQVAEWHALLDALDPVIGRRGQGVNIDSIDQSARSSPRSIRARRIGSQPRRWIGQGPRVRSASTWTWA